MKKMALKKLQIKTILAHFADVRTIMNNMGRAMMGTGEASGENRAIECAHNAVTNPLLDDYSLDGAKGLLINITGGTDLTLHEVDKITNEIREQVHPDADVIVGSIFDNASYQHLIGS